MRLPFALIAVSSLVAGCAQIPTEDLRTYADTSSTAQEAGNLLYDEVAPLFDGGGGPVATCDILASAGFRECFDPSLALGPEAARRNEPAEVRLRRLALGMIADYNDMLIELASGLPTERRRATFDSLVGSVNAGAALIPGQGVAAAGLLSAAAPVIGDLATRVGKIRDSNLAANSVLEARGAITGVIDALIDDSRTLYAVYFSPIQQPAGLALADLSIAQDEDNAAEIARQTALLEGYADRMRPFEEALIRYVQMLDRQKQALNHLAKAIQAPTSSPELALATLVRQATEAKAISEAFMLSIRSLRAP